MDNSQLNEFFKTYRVLNYNVAQDSRDITYAGKQFGFYAGPSLVTISLETTAFAKLVSDSAIAEHELRMQDIRAKNSAAQEAYDHYLTIIALTSKYDQN